MLREHHPHHTSGLSQLATDYMQVKDYKLAAEVFDDVLHIDPNNTMALQNYGELLLVHLC